MGFSPAHPREPPAPRKRQQRQGAGGGCGEPRRFRVPPRPRPADTHGRRGLRRTACCCCCCCCFLLLLLLPAELQPRHGRRAAPLASPPLSEEKPRSWRGRAPPRGSRLAGTLRSPPAPPTHRHTHTHRQTQTHTPPHPHPPQKARRGRSGRTNSEHLQTGAHSPRLPGRAAAPGREPCRRRAAPRPPRGCRLRWGKASGTGEFTAPGHRLRLGCFGKRHSRCSPSSPQGSGSQFSASRCCLVSLLVTQHYLLGLTKGLPCHRQRERHAWRCAADSAPRTVL